MQGKVLLGIKQEVAQNVENDGEMPKAASESETDTNVVSITVPDTVRVLLTQDHGQKPERSGVYVMGSTAWKASAAGVEAVVAAETPADCGAWMAQNGLDEALLEAENGGALSLADANGSVQGLSLIHILQIPEMHQKK